MRLKSGVRKIKNLILSSLTILLLISIIIFSKIDVRRGDSYNLNYQADSISINRNKMLDPVVKLSMVEIPPFATDNNPSSGIMIASATGFSVRYNEQDNQSYIITNDHFCINFIQSSSAIMIVENSRSPSISDPSGEEMIGRIIYSDAERDLCLVVTYGLFRPATLSTRYYNARSFEEVKIVGAPNGTFPIITDTYISGYLERKEIGLGAISTDGNDFILLSGIIFPGHSGSPVYNKDGEVIGILFAALETYGSIAIPIIDLYDFLDEVFK